MNRKALILSIPMILAILLLGGWFVLHGQRDVQDAQKQPTVGENPAKKPPVIDSANGEYREKSIPQPNLDIETWKLYKNFEYGFEVKIPSDWEVDIQEMSSRERAMRRTENPYSINDLINDPGSSVSISFGPRESRPGGYLFGLFLTSFGQGVNNNTAVDLTAIKNYFRQRYEKEADKNRFVYENFIFNGVSGIRECPIAGCNKKGVKDYEQIAFFRKGIFWKVGEGNADDDSIEEAFPLFLKNFRFID